MAWGRRRFIENKIRVKKNQTDFRKRNLRTNSEGYQPSIEGWCRWWGSSYPRPSVHVVSTFSLIRPTLPLFLLFGRMYYRFVLVHCCSFILCFWPYRLPWSRGCQYIFGFKLPQILECLLLISVVVKHGPWLTIQLKHVRCRRKASHSCTTWSSGVSKIQGPARRIETLQ